MTSLNRTVEVLDGNPTIRRLMTSLLEEAGISVVSHDGEGEQPVEFQDLLIVDIDSGVAEPTERAAAYHDDDRIVLYCGLRGSREKVTDERWLQRPFSPSVFLAQCFEAIGLEKGGPESVPTFLGEGDDEPITRELAYDEAQELEKRLGLEPGAMAPPSAAHRATTAVDESFEILDIDDSNVIVEVADLEMAMGGTLIGGVEARRITGEELAQRRESEPLQVRTTRSTTFNQTMPDTPKALVADEGEDTPSSPIPSVDLSTSGDADLQTQIKGVARMLAESWQRIALTARTDDRADRIERVLSAAVGKGLRGAADEVQRIPSATGFAGTLSALTFVDTIRTVRDRRLRGRLEVAAGDEAYVVYLDGEMLAEIDALSGNLDLMLLDILQQGGALDDSAFEEYREAVKSGSLPQPLETALVLSQVVTEATLLSARSVRARETFRFLCSHRGGSFAFLEIQPGDGQPWPIAPLRLNVDQLMLELLRESPIDTGDSQATARTRLIADPGRAASLRSTSLTEEERDVLNFFRDGETLAEARERLQRVAVSEDVDRIVDRLKKVEILRRSDPTIPIPDQIPGVQREISQTSQRPSKPEKTAVSDLTEVLSEEERLKLQLPGEKTTSLKPSHAIAPPDVDTEEVDGLAARQAPEPTMPVAVPIPPELDSGEVDALVDEAIAMYDRHLSESTDATEDD